MLADGHIIGGRRGGACSFGWAVADLAIWKKTAPGGSNCTVPVKRLIASRWALACATARPSSKERALATVGRWTRWFCPMRALGVALAGAVALLDPEAIIFAGGVAAALDILGPLIRRALISRLPPHMCGVGLRAAQFGKRATLVGAAFAGARGVEWRGPKDA